jgi:NADH:ubiquinone oxidoreductase subunit E
LQLIALRENINPLDQAATDGMMSVRVVCCFTNCSMVTSDQIVRFLVVGMPAYKIRNRVSSSNLFRPPTQSF